MITYQFGENTHDNKENIMNNFKKFPDSEGIWLVIYLEQDLIEKTEVVSVEEKLMNDKTLFVSKYHGPSAPRYLVQNFYSEGVDSYNQPNYRWVLLSKDLHGKLLEVEDSGF